MQSRGDDEPKAETDIWKERAWPDETESRRKSVDNGQKGQFGATPD